MRRLTLTLKRGLWQLVRRAFHYQLCEEIDMTLLPLRRAGVITSVQHHIIDHRFKYHPALTGGTTEAGIRRHWSDLRAAFPAMALMLALAVPAQAQNIQAESVSHDTPYVAGSIYSTLTSFDGNIGGTTEPAFLASLVGRLPLGSRLAFALRLDSQPQSGQVPFGSLDTWYSGQLAASTSFEFSRGERWQAGVHATGALTYALSDLEGQFGRSLDARPKLWFAGPYLRDSANGAFAYAGIGKDQVAAGDGKWTMFATVTVPFLETSTIRIDVTIPLGTEAVPHAGRLVAGIGIPVFSRRAE